MRNKDTSIGGFADYARNVNKYKKNQRSYQERMEYVKALFEVHSHPLPHTFTSHYYNYTLNESLKIQLKHSISLLK